MSDWLHNYLPARAKPRLWVEWVSLLESREPISLVRTVHLHPGMNVIWAREPEDDTASGFASAGHGVGKTSFCLLLRYCLGDEAPSITALREKASAGFPKGGVAAKMHLDGHTWVAFRPYGQYAQSWAGRGDSLEALFASELSGSFQELQDCLRQSFIDQLTMTTLPGNNQPLEWRHLLAWCIRDQKTRFDTFFHWRDGDALGFRRPRQDPPLFVQAVLGLYDKDLDTLLREIETAEQKVRQLDTKIPDLERLPAFKLAEAERRLRVRVNASGDMPLFANTIEQSVQQLVEERLLQIEESLKALESRVNEADEALAEATVQLADAARADKLADLEVRSAEAVLANNEAEFERLQTELVNLQNLSGHCRFGDVAFADCQHVLERRSSESMKWHLRRQAASAGVAKQEVELQQLRVQASTLRTECQRIEAKVREKRAIVRRHEMARWGLEDSGTQLKQLWNDLLQMWSDLQSGTGAGELELARAQRNEAARDVDNKKTKLTVRRMQVSERARLVAQLTQSVVGRLLGDSRYGRFMPNSDSRPFELNAGGEAYQVLEVLVGDVVSMLDAVTSQSGLHPGFVVHDCPREADMSERLYREFLLMVAEAAGQLQDEGIPPFQYIVTTTSPPPVTLQSPRHVVLELRPGSDEDLLFKRRLVPELDGFG